MLFGAEDKKITSTPSVHLPHLRPLVIVLQSPHPSHHLHFHGGLLIPSPNRSFLQTAAHRCIHHNMQHATPDPCSRGEAPKTGTTIVACCYADGVVIGADSRVSTGTYVSNRASDKTTPLCDNVWLLRSGSAADTQLVSDYGAPRRQAPPSLTLLPPSSMVYKPARHGAAVAAYRANSGKSGQAGVCCWVEQPIDDRCVRR